MYKNLVLTALLAALALSVAIGVLAQESTSTVEVRVWERIGDPEQNYISARPAGGSWSTLGTIPLDLEGESRSGAFRYADITLAIPLPDDGPDLGPSSPWAQRVDVTCTFYRRLWGDASTPNLSWAVEGTFSHRLSYTITVHIGVQPQRPDDVPEHIDPQVWDERAVTVRPLPAGGQGDPVPHGTEAAWSIGIGAGPIGSENYYPDFPSVYVVSFYVGDPINRRVALDPPIECTQTADDERYY
ncbi:MAG: hypothetical protein F4045_02740 [Chloroflexi bacterium]|nr:hypothetical protein [Chloroflexota bacterium]